MKRLRDEEGEIEYINQKMTEKGIGSRMEGKGIKKRKMEFQRNGEYSFFAFFDLRNSEDRENKCVK